MKFFTQNMEKPNQFPRFRMGTAVVAAGLLVPLLVVSSSVWASGDKSTKPALAPPAKSSRAKKIIKPTQKASRARRTSAAARTKSAPAATRQTTKAIVQAVKSPVAPLLRPIPPFQKTMPRGSYLVKPARLDDAAYRQAITRPMILQRYQYAWKTTPEETLKRLRGLRLTRLPQMGVYRVYYARANGAWGYKVRRVPAGTLVFTLPDTPRPLMLQVCGNPVEEVLPPRNAKRKDMIPPFSPQEGDTGLVLENLGDTGDLYAFTPQTPDFLGAGDTLSGDSGSLMPIPPVLADTLGTSGNFTFPIPVGTGAFNLGGLIFPIVGTAIGSQINNLGGNNSSGSNNQGGVNVDFVPEPSGGVFSAVIVGTMGFALAWPTLAKRRRKG